MKSKLMQVALHTRRRETRRHVHGETNRQDSTLSNDDDGDSDDDDDDDDRLASLREAAPRGGEAAGRRARARRGRRALLQLQQQRGILGLHERVDLVQAALQQRELLLHGVVAISDLVLHERERESEDMSTM